MGLEPVTVGTVQKQKGYLAFPCALKILTSRMQNKVLAADTVTGAEFAFRLHLCDAFETAASAPASLIKRCEVACRRPGKSAGLASALEIEIVRSGKRAHALVA